MMLYVEMPDAALHWAGPGMTPLGGAIASSVPEPIPESEARELYRRLGAQGRQASLYRKVGKRLILDITG